MPRGRTRLTVPPGQEPAPPDQRQRPDVEQYSPGLALPTEPHIVGRGVKRLAVVAVLLAVAGAGYAGVMIAGRGQDEDPALSRTPTPAASQLPGGGETTGTPRGGGRGGGAGGGATPSITPTPSVTGTPSPS